MVFCKMQIPIDGFRKITKSKSNSKMKNRSITISNLPFSFIYLSDPILKDIDDIFGKDSIWFTEKGKDENSQLFSLVEFKGLNKLRRTRQLSVTKNFEIVWVKFKGCTL